MGEAWTIRSWAVSSVVWHRPGNDPFQAELQVSASITHSILYTRQYISNTTEKRSWKLFLCFCLLFFFLPFFGIVSLPRVDSMSIKSALYPKCQKLWIRGRRLGLLRWIQSNSGGSAKCASAENCIFCRNCSANSTSFTLLLDAKFIEDTIRPLCIFVLIWGRFNKILEWKLYINPKILWKGPDTFVSRPSTIAPKLFFKDFRTRKVGTIWKVWQESRDSSGKSMQIRDRSWSFLGFGGNCINQILPHLLGRKNCTRKCPCRGSLDCKMTSQYWTGIISIRFLIQSGWWNFFVKEFLSTFKGYLICIHENSLSIQRNGPWKMGK